MCGEKLRPCSRCGTITYCSRECAAAHWPHHKAGCRHDNLLNPRKYKKAKAARRLKRLEEEAIEAKKAMMATPKAMETVQVEKSIEKAQVKKIEDATEFVTPQKQISPQVQEKVSVDEEKTTTQTATQTPDAKKLLRQSPAQKELEEQQQVVKELERELAQPPSSGSGSPTGRPRLRRRSSLSEKLKSFVRNLSRHYPTQNKTKEDKRKGLTDGQQEYSMFGPVNVAAVA